MRRYTSGEEAAEEDATVTYEISSKTSGATVWTGEAASEAAALDAMARDAGYRDHADACEQSGDDGAHLVVAEVEVAITDEQIEALMTEAGAAGDQAQVALCLVALDREIDSDLDMGDASDVALAVDRRRALERIGIIPEHLGAVDAAREACASAIRAAKAAA
jgi:hypothetical protein